MGLPILLCGGLVLAACSSSPSAPSASTTSTTAQPPRTSSTPPAPPSTSSTLPGSGPLQAGSPVAVPLTAAQVVAAEGPDGAVFVAAQDPESSAPSVVWVVDGQGPAAVAEHIPVGVAALAVDPSNLYVATYSDVTAFDRTTGNQSGHWNLPPVNAANASNDDLVSMDAADGFVFVIITQGNQASVYRITPSSPAAPSLVLQALGAVVGPDGTIYSERSDHHLVGRSPSGTTTVGAALADAPNGEGGGVQYLSTVAGGAVWVDQPAGQGLDAQWTTYQSSGLQQIAMFSGNAEESFVDTVAGPLVLSSPDAQSACTQAAGSPAQPGTWCVARVSLQGAQSDPVPFPSAIDLVGPDPVVIGENATSSQLTVTRLS